MSTALNTMKDFVRNAPAVLSEIKDRNSTRMIGYFSPVVPEELIFAAGFHPVRLYPWLKTPILGADAHLQTYVCSYVRAAWDQIIQEEHAYVDGAIISRSCEAVTFLYPTWRRHFPKGFVDYLNVPWKKSENAIQFFKNDLERVWKNLITFSGGKASFEGLKDAIRRYNTHRSVLRKIYELRKAEPPELSGMDAFYVMMSGFILPKERHMRVMEQYLSEIDAVSAVKEKEPRVRILMSGGCVIDAGLWKLIESCGALIVADDVNNGARSILSNVAEEGDPMDALARTYIQRPCGFNTSISERFAFLRDLIGTHRVQGVIFAINKHCESEAFDYPQLGMKIREELGLATLLIETDYLNQTEPLRTRIEAFVEMLA